jgi:hypothetical protein
VTGLSRRSVPRVGMGVTVHYLSIAVPASVTETADDGRRVTAETEEGEAITFALNRATGHYQASSCGPRLSLAATTA